MPIARLVFAALLLTMALGQALSWPAFVSALRTYRVAGPGASTVLASALIGAEAAAGIALATRWPRVRVWAAWVGLGMAAVWAALAAQAFVRTLTIANCGCFGRYLAQRLSWWVLAQDGYFVLLAFLALRSARRDRPGRRAGSEGNTPGSGGVPSLLPKKGEGR